MDRRDVAAWVAASRERQGLPPTVTDVATLEGVARMVTAALAPVSDTEAAASGLAA